VYGTPGDTYINLSVLTPISGMVHTHPSGIKDANGNPVQMSMVPTPEDFAAIGNLFNAGKLTNPSQFTSVVITGLGTAYLLLLVIQTCLKLGQLHIFKGPAVIIHQPSLKRATLYSGMDCWESIQLERRRRN
jgi:hypothetical protein